MERKPSLFSKRLKFGKRNFFIDVKESKNQKKYMTICESVKGEDDKYTQNRLLLFEDNLPEFMDSLKESVDFINNKE